MTKWMKRSAAGVLAAALVCGSTPASVLMSSGLTAFAAEEPGSPISSINIVGKERSSETLVKGVVNTMTVNIMTYERMADYINAKIEIDSNELAQYLTQKAQKPTESYSAEDEVYTYTFTLTFDLTDADDLSTDWYYNYFYLCDKQNSDVHRSFVYWGTHVAKGTQYEVSADGSSLLASPVPSGDAETAVQIGIGNNSYNWEGIEDITSFDYSRYRDYYFRFISSDENGYGPSYSANAYDNLKLYRLDETETKTEVENAWSTEPYLNNEGWVWMLAYTALPAGTYVAEGTVTAYDAFDAETNTIGEQTFTLSKTFTIGETELDADALDYYFGFRNENDGRYRVDPEDVTEVPYTGNAYSLIYLDPNYYWSWSNDLGGSVYDSENDIYYQEGTDYIVTGDRGGIAVGTYSFTIEFINGYSGSKTFEWEIVDYDDNSAPYIEMTSYPYTENNMPVYYYGTEIKPVVYNNQQDGDVTFFYAQNKSNATFSEEVPTEPGKYKVYAIVSGNNGHEEYETYTATFQITKTGLDVYPDNQTITYGDALPELTCHFGTSMQFGYPTEGYVIGVYNNNGEEVTGKLDAGNYSLRVKSAPYSSSDKKHYDRYDHYGTLTVQPKRTSNILVQALPNIYTGTYQKPEFHVYADGEELINTEAMTQYKLFGTTVAKEAGTYNAQVQLCGNYKGFKAAQWEISEGALDINIGLDIVDVAADSAKVQFGLARNLSNIELISAGFIYTKAGADISNVTAEDFAESTDDIIQVGGKEVKKSTVQTTSKSGITRQRITDTGAGIAIKGYIQYHCASGTFYAYTDVLSTTYETAVDQIATTNYSIQVVAVEATSAKVQFGLSRKSQGVTPTECGFIYSKTGIKVDNIELDDPRIDGNTVKMDSSTNGASDLNLKKKITDTGDGISIRGFVKYLAGDGSERVAYTDALNITYDEACALMNAQ